MFGFPGDWHAKAWINQGNIMSSSGSVLWLVAFLPALAQNLRLERLDSGVMPTLNYIWLVCRLYGRQRNPHSPQGKSLARRKPTESGHRRRAHGHREGADVLNWQRDICKWYPQRKGYLR